MSEKREPPPTSAYGMTPGVSYPQMVPQGAPPSYAESLTHPVVAGHPGMPLQFATPYMTTTAPGSAASMQNYKDQIFQQSGHWYLADPMFLQNVAAAQQAQKVAQQQQAALYMQQQPQQMYLQQFPTHFQHPQAAAVAGAVPGHYQHGQNVLFLNGFDSGARFDGISQPSIPPAPPGVAPNAAQLAAASGAHVSATQKKSSFLSGGSGGGYTIF